MLRLDVRPSLLELGFGVVSHGSALAAVSLVNLPGLALGVLVLVIAPGFIRCILDHREFHRRRIHTVEIGLQESTLYKGKEQVKTGLPKVTFSSEWLIVLRFEPESLLPTSGQPVSKRSAPHFLVLLPDSLHIFQDRLLRRYLRFDRPIAIR